MTKIKNITNEIDIMNKTKKMESVGKMSFQDKYDRGLITKEGYDLSELNEKQIKYFRMMYPKSGVLFLTSAPGLAKSAIVRSIAENISQVEMIYKELKDGKDKNGEIKYREVVDKELSGKIIASKMFYIDLRLAMLDETDVGLFPDKKELKVTENGQEVMKAFLDHIVPKWAFYSNNPPTRKINDLPYCGTIIHFEELNRAPLAVRNAALQILLEREIGFEFKFNSNVFMVATGNLGEEDGTDVEEFDSALNGRLLHLTHTMIYDEWKKYYAEKNVHSLILNFLEAHPEYYYIGKSTKDNEKTENSKSYSCPRTWTFLSDYIKTNYGFNAPAQHWVQDIGIIGHAYIGSANVKFLRYVHDVLRISIQDIIQRYPEFQANNTIFNRDKKSELLQDLRRIDFKQLKPNEVENIKLFLLDMSEDEVSAYLLKILDDDYEFEEDVNIDAEKNGFILGFLRDKRFKKFNSLMLNFVGSKEEDKSTGFWNK